MDRNARDPHGSWWIGLSRADLEQQSADYGLRWRIGKHHVAFQTVAESFRDSWEPRGTRSTIVTSVRQRDR